MKQYVVAIIFIMIFVSACQEDFVLVNNNKDEIDIYDDSLPDANSTADIYLDHDAKLDDVEDGEDDLDIDREPLTQNPCQDYWWMEDYRWHCPGFRDSDIHLDIMEFAGECYLLSDICSAFACASMITYTIDREALRFYFTLYPDTVVECMPL